MRFSEIKICIAGGDGHACTVRSANGELCTDSGTQLTLRVRFAIRSA